MFDFGIVGRSEHLGYHRKTGDRLKGKRTDELGGVPGHHDLNAGSALLKPSQNLDCFIRRYATCDTQRNDHGFHPYFKKLRRISLKSGLLGGSLYLCLDWRYKLPPEGRTTNCFYSVFTGLTIG